MGTAGYGTALTLALGPLSGCLIPTPVAIFPAPCEASGQRICFRDEHRREVAADGILLLARKYPSIPFRNSVDGSDELKQHEIVAISRGEARSPSKRPAPGK